MQPSDAPLIPRGIGLGLLMMSQLSDIIITTDHVMIIDLTDSFFEYAATSRKAYTQSNWHASSFIKSSTSHLADLNLLDSKMSDL
jgi:hypothetical protein